MYTMKLKPVKEFTIDVNKWCRGGVNGPPALLNTEDKQCCLGFHCEAMGATRDDLVNVAFPCNLDIRVPSLSRLDKGLGVFYSTKLSCNLADTNDDTKISLFERIKKIRALYKAKGIRVRFKNIPKNAKNLK